MIRGYDKIRANQEQEKAKQRRPQNAGSTSNHHRPPYRWGLSVQTDFFRYIFQFPAGHSWDYITCLVLYLGLDFDEGGWGTMQFGALEFFALGVMAVIGLVGFYLIREAKK